MDEKLPNYKELTVIQHLQNLPPEIYKKAKIHILNSKAYENNCLLRVKSVKQALVLSFDFNNTSEPEFWWKIYDSIGNIEEKDFKNNPIPHKSS